MKYKIQYTPPYASNLPDNDGMIQYDRSTSVPIGYACLFLPQKDNGLINGIIISENQILDIGIELGLSLYCWDDPYSEYGDIEIASFYAKITTSAQISISNEQLLINIKPFNLDPYITSDNLLLYPNDEIDRNKFQIKELDSEKLLPYIKDFLIQSNFNAQFFEKIIPNSVISFSTIDE